VVFTDLPLPLIAGEARGNLKGAMLAKTMKGLWRSAFRDCRDADNPQAMLVRTRDRAGDPRKFGEYHDILFAIRTSSIAPAARKGHTLNLMMKNAI